MDALMLLPRFKEVENRLLLETNAAVTHTYIYMVDESAYLLLPEILN